MPRRIEATDYYEGHEWRMNVLEVTAYTGIEPGIHAIVVTGLETKQAKAGGEYLRWEFSRQDGKTTSANSSVEMTPGNKTGKWFAALTGRPTVVGEKRAISEVIGKPGTIVVELNADGFTKVIALTGREASGGAPRAAAAFAEAQHGAQEDQPIPETGTVDNVYPPGHPMAGQRNDLPF